MSVAAWNLRGQGVMNPMMTSVSSISFDPALELLWVGEEYGTLASYTTQVQNESPTWNVYSCFNTTHSNQALLRHIGFLGSGDDTLVTVSDRETIRSFKRGGISVMYLPIPPDTQPSIDQLAVSQAENTIYYSGFNGLTQLRLTEDWQPSCTSVPYESKIETISLYRSLVAAGTANGQVTLRESKDFRSVASQTSVSRSAVRATELFDNTLLVGYSDRTSTSIIKIFDIRMFTEAVQTCTLPNPGDGSSGMTPSTGVFSIRHYQDNFGPQSERAFVLTSQHLHVMQLCAESPSFTTMTLPEAGATCFAVSPSNTCAAVGFENGLVMVYGHPLTRTDFIMANAEQPKRPSHPSFTQSWSEISISTGFDEKVPEEKLASSWPEPHYMILTVPQKLHCVEKEVTTFAMVPNQWGLQRSDSYLPDRKDNLLARIPNPYPFNTMLGEDPVMAHQRLLDLRKEYKRRIKPSSRANANDDYGQMESANSLYGSNQKAPWKALNEIPQKVIGVDNSYPESWLGSLIQCLFLCYPPEFPIRKIILSHLCRREYCVTCELSFIFSNMLVAAASQNLPKEQVLPPIVQIGHLFRTMARLQAFEGVFDRPVSRDDAVAKIHRCQRILLKTLHKDLQDQQAYPLMKNSSASKAETAEYSNSISTYFGTEFEVNNDRKIEPRFYWEVPGSALKVDEGLQHLLKEMERSQEKVQIKRLPRIIVLLLNPEHSHLKPPFSLKISKYNGDDFNYILNSNVIHLADDVEDTGNFVSHQRISDDRFALINDYRVTSPVPFRELDHNVPALRSFSAVVSYYTLSQLVDPPPVIPRGGAGGAVSGGAGGSGAASGAAVEGGEEANRTRSMFEDVGDLLITDIFAKPHMKDKRHLFQSPLKSHTEIKKGMLVAIDAEYVVLKWARRLDEPEFGFPGIPQRKHMALARVSCIISAEPGDERTIVDDYVNTPEEIQDYVTQYSGIRPGDLDPLRSNKSLTALKATYLKLRALVDAGVIFVGHGLAQDFRVCNIVVPKRQILDTLLLFHKTGSRYMSLRFLAYHILGEQVQEHEHDSIEDARTSLRLYRAYQKLKEEGTFEATLDHLLAVGAGSNWSIPSGKAAGDLMTMVEQQSLPSPLTT